ISALSPFIYTALRLTPFFCLAVGMAVLMRVGGDLAVVPSLGYVGGCVVAVFSEIAAFAILAYFLKRKGHPLWMANFLVKPILAGLFMAAILFPARQLPLFQALPLAGGLGSACLGAVFLLRSVRSGELRLLREGLS